MPQPALMGTYPHPAIANATVTAGWPYTDMWLADLFQHGPVPIAVDIETYGLGLDMLRIKCVTISNGLGAVVLDPRDRRDADLIRRALDYASVLFMHQATADAPSLCRNGLMRIEHIAKIVDTVLYARIAMPGETVPKRLESCGWRYLQIPEAKITDVFKSLGYSKSEGFRIMDIDSPVYLMGAGADGLVTYRIAAPVYQAAIDRLTTGHSFSIQGLNPAEAAVEVEKHQIVNRVMLRRTVRGLRVDVDYLEEYRNKTGTERAQGEAVLRGLGIDPGNGNQLAAWLQSQGALPADHRMTPSGKYGTAEDDLETLHHPVATTFVAVKKITKVLDDYLEKAWDAATIDGRIHPVTNVLAAAHGRMSMSGDSAIHQWPGPARGLILAEEGDELASVDWSQQEPMIGLNVAGDHTALHAYENLGEKLYTAIAAYGGISYDVAKVVLLAGMYGEGKKKLSADLGLPPDPWVEAYTTSWGKDVSAHWGYQAAGDMQDATFSAIPKTRELLRTLKNMARDQGLVCTVNGRVLPIPMGKGFDGGPPGRQTHKGPNYFISGSALDMMTDTIVECERQGLGDAIYFGMHDELLVSASAAVDVQRIMETPPYRLCEMAKRRPRIRTDLAYLGKRWGKA